MTAHIQIVGRNDRHYLQACLESCLRQTIRTLIVYVDNASTDGSAEFVRNSFPTIHVIENRANRGYSGGHNNALRAFPSSDVAIVLNADTILDPDFVEQGLKPFSSDRVGAVAPLLVRPGGQEVDAYGIVLLPTLRAVEQYAGWSLSNIERLSVLQSPWGYTGAAVFLRCRALEDVALNSEIFDEDLFAYREEVDLSWRLRLRGWEIVGVPQARATHVRAARPGGNKEPLVARLSWRNYFLVLIKNVPTRTLIRHAPWIALESVARGFQWLFTPRLWFTLPELIRLLPVFSEKRSRLLARAAVAFSSKA
ncbi:MAG: glycosyltransferase family 2 protein [bacterium]|nr:glycosyltransferase family 2 protein [bacterium]